MLGEEQILKAFEKSMAEYDLVQKSKHWQGWFDRTKHLQGRRELLKDFRNNALSFGLDDQLDLLKTKERFCDLLAEVGPDFVFANLSSKNIGNAHHVFQIDDNVVDSGQLSSIRWLYDLKMHVFSPTRVVYVCEIGGGYGAFAQKIRSQAGCKYVMIDLPEANVLASYYLSKHFPEARFLLADDIQGNSVNKEQVDRHDFVIIPPWYKVGGVAFDLFINTRSMMEMNREVIQNYFDFIQNSIAPSGFFLNINRYYKDSVGYPVKLSEYPYDKNWHVVLSKPAFKQPIVHVLLTQRTGEPGNIQEELQRIEEMYQENARQGRKGFVKAPKSLLPGKRAIIALPFKLLRRLLSPSLYGKLKEALISSL